MARLDPWDEQYLCTALPQLERTLTAAGCPELPLTLEALDDLGVGVAVDLSEKYQGDYLHGNAERLALQLGIPSGQIPRLSKSTLTNIATIQAMQVSAAGEERYELKWWLGIIKKFPALWKATLALSDEVQKLYREQQPGNSAGVTASTP